MKSRSKMLGFYFQEVEKRKRKNSMKVAGGSFLIEHLKNEMLYIPILSKDNMVVFVDHSRDVAIHQTFQDYAGFFWNEDSVVAVKQGEEWFFINNKGEKISDRVFRNVFAVYDKYATVFDGRNTLLINVESNEVLISRSDASIYLFKDLTLGEEIFVDGCSFYFHYHIDKEGKLLADSHLDKYTWDDVQDAIDEKWERSSNEYCSVKSVQ